MATQLILLSAAFAQPPRGAGAPSEASRIKERKARERLQEFTAPQAPVIEEREFKKEEAGPSLKKISVKKIIIEGAALAKELNIKSFLGEYENRELSFAELSELCDKIKKAYYKKGYVVVDVFLPPQEVKDGIVRIKIVEGRIGEIKVEENRYFSKRLIAARFLKKKGRIFNYDEIKDILYYLNENPDREVKLVLYPGKKEGTVDLYVRVKDKLPIHPAYEYANLGNRYTGRNRHIPEITLNNLWGWDHYFDATAYLSEHDRYVGFSSDYVAPLWGWKKLGANFTCAQSLLGRELKPLNVAGRYYEGSIFLSDSFLREDALRIDGELRFTAKESTTKILAEEIYHDSPRIFNPLLKIIGIDKMGYLVVVPEFSLGLPDFMGGSPKKDPVYASRPDAGGEFNYFNLSVFRSININKDFETDFLMQSQFTNSSLPSTDGFRIGGMDTVRGYPEGEAIGDMGLLLTGEIKMPFLGVMKDFKEVRSVVFVDYGWVKYNEVSLDDKETTRLVGIGTGVRINIKDNWFGRVDFAFPAGDQSSEGGSMRVHFQLKARF